MLAAHPMVAYLPETAFLRRYVVAGVLASLYAVDGEEAVIRRLFEDESFSRLRLDATQLVRRALEAGGLLDVAIYRKILAIQRQDDCLWVGDKDPRLIEFLPFVAKLFPEATVINIIRDPRDVLLSKKKAAWSCEGHVWKHVFANRVQLKLGRINGPRFFRDYHEVIYEKLITSPREVLFGLCDRIGLPFDESMLSFGEAARKLVAQSEISWKKETFGPILADEKGKWKNGLSDREIYLTELCCKEAFRVGGYMLDNRNRQLSWLDRLWVFAGAAVICLADWPYRLFRTYRLKQACKRVE